MSKLQWIIGAVWGRLEPFLSPRPAESDQEGINVMISTELMATPARSALFHSPGNLSQVASGLSEVLGKKLTAYIGGARSVSEVDNWLHGDNGSPVATERIRVGLEVAQTLKKREMKGVIQAWFTGLNPAL